MDIAWLLPALPAAGIGYCAGWWTKPKPAQSELHARVADLERLTHSHAVAPAAPQAPSHGPHGPDFVAWGHDGKKHWRRHKDGTVHHSEDGKF